MQTNLWSFGRSPHPTSRPLTHLAGEAASSLNIPPPSPPSTFQILPFSPQWASPHLLRTYVTSILLGLLASGVSPDPAPLHGSNRGASPVQDLAGSLLAVKTEPSDLSGVGGSPH